MGRLVCLLEGYFDGYLVCVAVDGGRGSGPNEVLNGGVIQPGMNLRTIRERLKRLEENTEPPNVS